MRVGHHGYELMNMDFRAVLNSLGRIPVRVAMCSIAQENQYLRHGARFLHPFGPGFLLAKSAMALFMTSIP